MCRRKVVWSLTKLFFFLSRLQPGVSGQDTVKHHIDSPACKTETAIFSFSVLVRRTKEVHEVEDLTRWLPFCGLLDVFEIFEEAVRIILIRLGVRFSTHPA